MDYTVIKWEESIRSHYTFGHNLMAVLFKRYGRLFTPINYSQVFNCLCGCQFSDRIYPVRLSCPHTKHHKLSWFIFISKDDGIGFCSFTGFKAKLRKSTLIFRVRNFSDRLPFFVDPYVTALFKHASNYVLVGVLRSENSSEIRKFQKPQVFTFIFQVFQGIWLEVRGKYNLYEFPIQKSCRFEVKNLVCTDYTSISRNWISVPCSLECFQERFSGRKSTWVIMFYNCHSRGSIAQFFDCLESVICIHIVIIGKLFPMKLSNFCKAWTFYCWVLIKIGFLMPVFSIAKFYAVSKFQPEYFFVEQGSAQISVNSCIIIRCVSESFNRKFSPSFF
ncbi:hypothetical protein SDC9_136719 [bioreactor metagenome]|uniref:Uncharacterized protein n=1 Tax=bioreactor metagenome TaxID=1076179 RepID=A0A645DK07_9ZZZZ